MKVRVNPKIVMKNILEFYIEMVLKFENDFEISEFYPSRIFVKVEKLRDFFEKLKFLENRSGGGSCPSSFPSGNQVDGSPLVAIIPKQWLSGPEGTAARRCAGP